MTRLEKIRDQGALQLSDAPLIDEASECCQKSYKEGFNAASAEYEKIISELENTLQKIGSRELESWGAMYEDMAEQALSKLKEFRGKDE